ncbi:DNA-directed RNA polymerase subunit omega [Bacillus horti]|uniref:DNA-directed RNA polymerase subunit omega n=1 Tax=Caldalkalibacillus horti TaxID=77523 RepID=A0ABT9VXT4_9BACI|nr:DNA-directed RNA polymerase subunit omega [Bacillus horti]MDQ0165695.1 DNA-directed RNA polymerase subunit omega [Bacillus horti]
MLYPSIDVLLEKLDSKYTLVSVASRRARQLREKNNLLIEKPRSAKYVGKALEEIVTDKVSFESAILRPNKDKE